MFLLVKETVCPILGMETSERENFPHLFEGLTCTKNYVYDIELVENPNFRKHPARVIPHTLRETVKKELDQMERVKVISKATEPTPAVSPMVIVKQKDKIRICLDTTDINKNINYLYQ